MSSPSGEPVVWREPVLCTSTDTSWMPGSVPQELLGNANCTVEPSKTGRVVAVVADG